MCIAHLSLEDTLIVFTDHVHVAEGFIGTRIQKHKMIAVNWAPSFQAGYPSMYPFTYSPHVP